MELSKVKVGERLSFTYYTEVLEKNGDSLKVKDSNGQTFTIKDPKGTLFNSIDSAAQFSTEKKVSRTDAVNALLSARDSVFTVNYDKADGTNRTLVGRLLDNENLLGRSNVIDLELPSSEKNKMRQVDHRTIHWLILRGVKYTVK